MNGELPEEFLDGLDQDEKKSFLDSIRQNDELIEKMGIDRLPGVRITVENNGKGFPVLSFPISQGKVYPIHPLLIWTTQMTHGHYSFGVLNHIDPIGPPSPAKYFCRFISPDPAKTLLIRSVSYAQFGANVVVKRENPKPARLYNGPYYEGRDIKVSMVY